ncbi:hypothetical protein HHI36_019652 [Cryptolaemus montrouzieri]|uniref:Retropepsins domain-containing protein n=1 Tax=Cryptolaemus montrouzieri TaxID=559131 RepID=A0ABD2N8F5_9CUCU
MEEYDVGSNTTLDLLSSTTAMLFVLISQTSGDESMIALIDTGSEICCFNEQVWNMLEPFHKEIVTFPGTGVKVSRAYKAKQRAVKQQSSLQFDNRNHSFEYEFLLIPDWNYPIILGIDFLRSVPSKFDFESRKLLLKFNTEWVEIPEVADPPTELTRFETCDIRLIKSSGDSNLIDNSFIIEHCSDEFSEKVQEIVNNSPLNIISKLLLRYRKIFSDTPGRTTVCQQKIKLIYDDSFSVNNMYVEFVVLIDRS